MDPSEMGRIYSIIFWKYQCPQPQGLQRYLPRNIRYRTSQKGEAAQDRQRDRLGGQFLEIQCRSGREGCEGEG